MSIRADLRAGRDLGAPMCCRLRWAIEYALNPDSEQALERGIRLTRDRTEFVPCGILHKATWAHAEYEHLINTPAQ